MRFKVFFLVFFSNYLFGQLEVEISKNGKIKSGFEVTSDVIYTFKEKRKATVNGFNVDFYEICYEEICGYINELWIIPDEKFLKYKQDNLADWEKKRSETSNIEVTRMLERQDARRQMLIKKYGKENGETVARGSVSLGMSKEMVLDARGKPNRINETTGSWGTKEQWVYSKSYLYFENGKLTSIQQSY